MSNIETPPLGEIVKLPSYTGDEIVVMFEKSSLPTEMKSEILGKLGGYETAMLNILEGKRVSVSDPHGDWWLEGYNECVRIFQSYNL